MSQPRRHTQEFDDTIVNDLTISDSSSSVSNSVFCFQLTGFRVLTILTVLCFGIPKAVASYQGRSALPTSLDWIYGVPVTLVLLALSWWHDDSVKRNATRTFLFTILFEIDYSDTILGAAIYLWRRIRRRLVYLWRSIRRRLIYLWRSIRRCLELSKQRRTLHEQDHELEPITNLTEHSITVTGFKAEQSYFANNLQRRFPPPSTTAIRAVVRMPLERSDSTLQRRSPEIMEGDPPSKSTEGENPSSRDDFPPLPTSVHPESQEIPSNLGSSGPSASVDGTDPTPTLPDSTFDPVAEDDIADTTRSRLDEHHQNTQPLSALVDIDFLEKQLQEATDNRKLECTHDLARGYLQLFRDTSNDILDLNKAITYFREILQMLDYDRYNPIHHICSFHLAIALNHRCQRHEASTSVRADIDEIILTLGKATGSKPEVQNKITDLLGAAYLDRFLLLDESGRPPENNDLRNAISWLKMSENNGGSHGSQGQVSLLLAEALVHRYQLEGKDDDFVDAVKSLDNIEGDSMRDVMLIERARAYTAHFKIRRDETSARRAYSCLQQMKGNTADNTNLHRCFYDLGFEHLRFYIERGTREHLSKALVTLERAIPQRSPEDSLLRLCSIDLSIASTLAGDYDRARSHALAGLHGLGPNSPYQSKVLGRLHWGVFYSIIGDIGLKWECQSHCSCLLRTVLNEARITTPDETNTSLHELLYRLTERIASNNQLNTEIETQVATLKGWSAFFLLDALIELLGLGDGTLSPYIETWISLLPSPETLKRSWLKSPGISSLKRLKGFGDIIELNQTIMSFQNAVRLTPDGHPDQPSLLNNLGNSFLGRFERLGDLDDINQSVSKFEQAVQLTPDGHPDKPSRLNNLGNSLSIRFVRLGELDDINQAVSRNEAARELTPDGHPDKPSRLNNLGNSLSIRFVRLGDLDDLNQAVSKFEEALRLTPDGHPDKPSRLNNLGNSLSIRFVRLGDLDDIHQSVLRVEEALQLTPDGHPDKPSRLSNLGNSLLGRFERLGDLDDLNQSVSKFEKALRLTPDGHPDKPSRLNNVGNSLSIRFVRLGDLDGIHQSVLRVEEALQLTPDGHPDEPSRLSNLGNSLLGRFERLGDLDDLIQSVSKFEKALRLTPDGHPDKPSRLNNVGNSLSIRFGRLGDLDDINKSVLRVEEALQLTPDGHPDKPSRLSNLGNSLLGRFERLGDLDDLIQSVSKFEKALRLTPDGHPDKPSRLNNLGKSLLDRFERHRNLNDIENAIQSFSTAALSFAGPATKRFHAASTWAGLAVRFTPSAIIQSYTTAIELLPKMAWQGLTMADRQYHLLEAGSVVQDAVSAAIEIKDLQKAIEWFDQGRSVIWSQLFNLRTNNDDLKMKHPDYANRLSMLSKQLDGSNTQHMRVADAGSNRLETDATGISQCAHELAHQRETLLTSIRNLEGFDQFLLPRKFAQLQTAAKDAIVSLVNISKRRCDALILMPDHDDVIHVPLNNFDLATAEELHRSLQDICVAKGCRIAEFDAKSSRDDYRKLQAVSGLTRVQRLQRRDPDIQFPRILRELWERVVKPILEGLAFNPEDQRDHDLPRISWCLTGPLTFLPIHAAGIYDDKMGPKLSDYAISSYIPTLSNLLSRSQSMPTQKPQLLAVALPLESKLKDTDGDVSKITAAASGLVESITLMEENATADEVVKYMKNASFVHFACHGYQHLTDPTQSALLLAKGSRLTLERISRLHLPNAEFAFLAACQTAAGDERLAQEAVHLAAGMLQAGYRGVVATMWSIHDSHVPILADEFYRTLFNTSNPDATHAARALHKAVNKLKEEVGENSFLEWVPFIHMGV